VHQDSGVAVRDSGALPRDTGADTDSGAPDTRIESHDSGLLPADAETFVPGEVVSAHWEPNGFGNREGFYYIARDHKRYAFPGNWTFLAEQTLLSWYMTTRHVRRVDFESLRSVQIGGYVTFRPGTFLVRITADPKFYAVTRPNVLHWITTDALAFALYGYWWQNRVINVPDGFFANYTTGTPVTTPVHPDGTVVNYSSGSPNWWQNVYVIENGTRRPFTSAEAFNANRFNHGMAPYTTIQYPNGRPITGYEYELAEPIVIR